jgi:Pentapeptide repeats (8 copies)
VADEAPNVSRRRRRSGRWGFRGTTVSDWLPIVGVFLIPISIALGTWAITWQQGKLEQRRVLEERYLAGERARDEALQTYLSEMGSLLLEEDLRDSERGSEVRTLARARTLTVLEMLDPERKSEAMQFLDEANLVHTTPSKPKVPVIPLEGVNLAGADLWGANFTGAHLESANLAGADLRRANLTDGWLIYTDLSGADLENADLSGVHLHAADFRRADLRGAIGITNEELEQQAISLEGATMPNGQKYEEWLNNKDRGEEGENSGTS